MVNSNVKYNVNIADDCISIIAGVSATSVEGVLNLGDNNMTNKLLPFLGTKNLKKGIYIEKENNDLIIKISISIKDGYNIEDVCIAVQEKVKDAIESMLDVNVKEVSINVVNLAAGE